MNDFTEVLAARWIFPISAPPINRGWIRRRRTDGQIVEFGAGPAPQPASDLGDAALLPGLVNAHTHLEFSDCLEPVGSHGVKLAEWIGQVIRARSGASPRARAAAIARGAAESLRAGVRLVGEIATPPYPVETAHGGSAPGALQRVTFAEVLGLTEQRGAERLEASRQHHAAHPDAGWSPHAPYSTTTALIDECVRLARQHQRPVAMHVAESPDERELLTQGTGAFADALRGLGVWQEGLFPWGREPFVHLIDRLAEAPRVLLIHGNDLRDVEIERLAASPHITVVYCPRTHAFFDYDRHPVARMLAHGVPVALGTDSRASNPDLNLWKEVQFLLDRRSDLDPEQVLRMATIHGADALGRPDVGRIEPGGRPGLGYVITEAATLEQVFVDFGHRGFRPLEDHG